MAGNADAGLDGAEPSPGVLARSFGTVDDDDCAGLRSVCPCRFVTFRPGEQTRAMYRTPRFVAATGAVGSAASSLMPPAARGAAGSVLEPTMPTPGSVFPVLAALLAGGPKRPDVLTVKVDP